MPYASDKTRENDLSIPRNPFDELAVSDLDRPMHISLWI